MLFFPGTVVATPSALEVLNSYGICALDLVMRHCHGDWSEMCVEDRIQNEIAVREGHRVLSSYRIDASDDIYRCWAITEADRSVTTVLLPEDY